jgi:hypothetical protein
MKLVDYAGAGVSDGGGGGLQAGYMLSICPLPLPRPSKIEGF